MAKKGTDEATPIIRASLCALFDRPGWGYTLVSVEDPRDVISERGIRATAILLIKRFGDTESFHAATRADELLAQGNMGGQRVWIRIAKAVEKLLRNVPAQGKPIN